MKIERIFKFAISAVVVSIAMTSCSDDPEESQVYRRVIDFENVGLQLAGPTSYGENLYANYDGRQFIKASIEVEKGVQMEFGLNFSQYDNAYDFTAGGMVLSQWNYRSNPEGTTAADWWYSYLNQCSVYNAASTDGANKGAGYNGSNTFTVINGYDGTFMSAPSFSFTAGAEYLIENIQICPTSYLYGILINGNPYGNEPGMSLEHARGWFKILAYGFDAAGNPTNGGNPVEKYICDFRNGNNVTAIPTTWTSWNLSALGRVNKVQFSFEGSDTGAYGLNTPAYMCVDDITIRMN